jgi:hypothetical protein
MLFEVLFIKSNNHASAGVRSPEIGAAAPTAQSLTVCRHFHDTTVI